MMNTLAILLDASAEITVSLGSAIDGLIGIIIIVGAIIGFKRGVIVECISFFAVLVCLAFSSGIARWFYRTFMASTKMPDLFAAIIMSIVFVAGLVFVISRVTFKTQTMLQTTILGASARYLGSVFSALKYYLISAVFLVVIFKIDYYVRFLPPEASGSAISRTSINFITWVYPPIDFKATNKELFDHPNEKGN